MTKAKSTSVPTAADLEAKRQRIEAMKEAQTEAFADKAKKRHGVELSPTAERGLSNIARQMKMSDETPRAKRAAKEEVKADRKHVAKALAEAKAKPVKATPTPKPKAKPEPKPKAVKAVRDGVRKLTEEDVRKIRSPAWAELSARKIGEKIGCTSLAYINAIKKGKARTEVK